MEANQIIDRVNDAHILMKAYRRTLGLSQRKLGRYLLCSQSSVCRYETKQFRYLSDCEQKRILYNFSIDFNERIKERKNKVDKKVFCISVCAAYLELTKGKKYTDYDDIANLIIKLSEDLRKYRRI